MICNFLCCVVNLCASVVVNEVYGSRTLSLLLFILETVLFQTVLVAFSYHCCVLVMINFESF